MIVLFNGFWIKDAGILNEWLNEYFLKLKGQFSNTKEALQSCWETSWNTFLFVGTFWLLLLTFDIESNYFYFKKNFFYLGNWWNTADCFVGDKDLAGLIKRNNTKTPVEEYWE
jgi:hypothetical protein